MQKFGTDFVGDIPWGTHLCQFYETKHDLSDILVPYFAEGLRSNEACIWITSEPLEVEEATAALEKAVPDIDRFIKNGQLLILPYTEWYLKDGTFDPNSVLQGWIENEQEALSRGFEGLRLTGNTFWIERSLWNYFADYEETINNVLGAHRIIAVCTYSLRNCSGSDVIDVIRNHGGTIIKKGAIWLVVEDVVVRKEAEVALQEAHKEVQSLNEELRSTNEEFRVANETLEERVKQRTEKLASYVEQLQRHKTMVDLASEGIIVFDVEGHITYWNHGAERLYGWSADDARGMKIHSFLQTESPALVEEIRRTLFEKGAWHGELTHVTERGELIVVESYQTLQRDAAGNPTAVFEINTDITDRKHAEEQLRAASLYARSLIEASLDPLVTISADGKITDVNQATEEVTGRSREELIGSDFSDYFTEPSEANAGYKQVFTDGFVRDYPLAIRHTSGNITDVLYNATLFKNEQGAIQGVFAAARDITDRKRAEEQLRSASLYTRSLIEASLDPLVTISVDGKITDVNKATEEVTGRSREELMGSEFSDYFTEPEEARKGYRQVFAAGFVRDYPLAIRHKSGSIRDVLYNATVFRNDSGEIQGVFAAARDITKQKQAQDALMEAHEEVRSLNEALESTNKELRRYSQHLEELIAERTSQLRDAERLAGIGETAAMIGHDLRNPLQGLQYIVDLQKLRFERVPPEKRGADDWKNEEGLFDRISEQVFYMDKIVADLQDYARPIALEPEIVAVSTVINDVIASVPHTDHVKIISDVSYLTVMADPHLMHRVFANLVLNAIQAMPDGGTLTISASRFDDSVAINVHDTGVGIPQEMRDKLFLPLSTGKAKGTGLGLAVVKRAVDAHRGTITFESGWGKGTTFTVTLPTTSG